MQESANFLCPGPFPVSAAAKTPRPPPKGATGTSFPPRTCAPKTRAGQPPWQKHCGSNLPRAPDHTARSLAPRTAPPTDRPEPPRRPPCKPRPRAKPPALSCNPRSMTLHPGNPHCPAKAPGTKAPPASGSTNMFRKTSSPSATPQAIPAPDRAATDHPEPPRRPPCKPRQRPPALPCKLRRVTLQPEKPHCLAKLRHQSAACIRKHKHVPKNAVPQRHAQAIPTPDRAATDHPEPPRRPPCKPRQRPPEAQSLRSMPRTFLLRTVPALRTA